MLQLIVLGIIPGTSIQLTFFDIMLIALTLVAVIASVFYFIGHGTRKQAKKIAEIYMISL